MKLVTGILFVSLVTCNGVPTREKRQFGLFNWLTSDSSEPVENVLPLGGGRRVGPAPSQSIQRRISQLPQQGNHNPRRIPSSRKSPTTTFRRPVGPPPGFKNRMDSSPKQPKQNTQVFAKRKLLLPIISSSYVSTNIQGQGHSEHIQDILHSDEKTIPALAALEEQIIDELNNSVESEEIIAEVKEIKAPQLDELEELLEELIELEELEVDEQKDKIISTTSIPTTTTVSTTKTTTSTTTSTTHQSNDSPPDIITEIEIDDYEEQSPYLPAIADDLQDHILIIVEQPNLQTITIPREPITLSKVTSTNSKNSITDPNEVIINPKKPQSNQKTQEKYLAGYQEVFPANPSNSRGERPHDIVNHEDRPAHLPSRKETPNKADFFPLGKPTPRKTTRKPIKNKPPPKKVQKPESTGGSFFDFLPFIGTSAPSPSTGRPRQKPRRPVGPNAGLTPPVLVKVGDSHPSETAPPGTLHIPEPAPIRSFFADRPSQDVPQRPTITDNQINSARIDDQFYAETPDIQKAGGEEPYIVLPSTINKKQQFQTRPGPYNKKYQTKNNSPLNNPAKRIQPSRPDRRPRPSPPANPLSMTSQPIIGLPHGPPSRKQTPFQVKKPLFPPQLPSYQAHNIHPQPPNRPLSRPRPQQNPLKRFQQQARPNQHARPNQPPRPNQQVRHNKPNGQKPRPNKPINLQGRPNQPINQQARLQQQIRTNQQARPGQPINQNVRPKQPISRPRAPVQPARPLPRILSKQGPGAPTRGTQKQTQITEQNSQPDNILPAITAQKSELKSESYLQDSNPFSLKPTPDKSSPPLSAESAITSHLSSLLNTYLFSSTSTQPPPTLPRRVFDVVNDYAPPDSVKSTQTNQITTNKIELSTSTDPTTTTTTTSSTSTTTTVIVNKGFQILYEDNAYIDNTIETGEEPLSTTFPTTDRPTSRIAEHIKVEGKDIDAAIDVMSAPKPKHQSSHKIQQQKIAPRVQHQQIAPKPQRKQTQITSTEALSTPKPSRPTQVTTLLPITTQIPVAGPTTNSPYTSPSVMPIKTEGPFLPITEESPLQNIINEYKDRVHPEMSEQFSDTVINTITKNFEHKKNIFEQFVSNSNFETLDQPFIPNSQVFASDWSLSNPFNFEKRKIENKPVQRKHSVEEDATFRTRPTPKGQRDFETGFKPMNKPMEQPLFTK